MKNSVVVINPKDNVGVVIKDIRKDETVIGGVSSTIRAVDDIPKNHKIALVDIPAGSPIIKYGEKIGFAGEMIAAGRWVHTHNLKVEDT
ncbi:MAG: UxaA family hydrolase [Deltaproteobacteria bacterium]|nr:UxaA family hydrolase [Candidatus Zymogenaceae bacterium]